MKRTSIFLGFLIFLTLIISCSEKSSPTKPKQAAFNPPSWILGTWLDEPEILYFEFIVDDVIYCDLSFKETYSYRNVNETTITSSKYEFVIDSELKFTFDKITDTSFNYYFDGHGPYLYHKI